MILQNININFSKSSIYSIFENTEYSIPTITNMASLLSQLDIEAGFTSETMVIQYTIDQYGQGADPRIVANNGEVTKILPLSSISIGLADELSITRAEIEAEITNQL